MKALGILFSTIALVAATSAFAAETPAKVKADPNFLAIHATCDSGKTDLTQYHYPRARLMVLVVASKNEYTLSAVLDDGNNIVRSYFFKDARTGKEILLSAEAWRAKLQKESPNYVQRINDAGNDCAIVQ